MQAGAQNAVQHVCNLSNACFDALSGMAAGMKIIEIARQMLHPLQVVCDHVAGKLPQMRIR